MMGREGDVRLGSGSAFSVTGMASQCLPCVGVGECVSYLLNTSNFGISSGN